MNFVFVVVYFETMNDVINVFKIRELPGYFFLSRNKFVLVLFL